MFAGVKRGVLVVRMLGGGQWRPVRHKQYWLIL